jgi:radical SAM superfamily enzyme YgiQ (UPF0313 family)
MYGIESFDQYNLNYINKETNIKQIENIIDMTSKFPYLEIVLKIIVDLPGDNYEKIIENLQYFKTKYKNIKISTHHYMPIPGTELYQHCIDNDLLISNDYDNFSYFNSVIKGKEDTIMYINDDIDIYSC